MRSKSGKRLLLAVVLLGLVGAALLAVLRETEHYELDDTFRARAPGSFIDLQQGKVHYELAGPAGGPVVVLVHGFSTPFFIWDPTFEALVASGFRVLRYDLYGRGYSDRPDTTYDRELYEQQLHGLLEALGIEPPVDLVGLSMGGAVVACFAASFPEEVRRLTFIAPFIGPVDATPVTVPGFGEYLARVVYAPTLPARQKESFHRPERAAPDLTERFSVQMSYRGYRRALLRTLKDFMGEDLSGVFAEVGQHRKPTLLIWGRQDAILPFTDHERILGALDAEFFAVDDAGHVPHLEHPDIVGSKIMAFLQGG